MLAFPLDLLEGLHREWAATFMTQVQVIHTIHDEDKFSLLKLHKSFIARINRR